MRAATESAITQSISNIRLATVMQVMPVGSKQGAISLMSAPTRSRPS